MSVYCENSSFNDNIKVRTGGVCVCWGELGGGGCAWHRGISTCSIH